MQPTGAKQDLQTPKLGSNPVWGSCWWRQQTNAEQSSSIGEMRDHHCVQDHQQAKLCTQKEKLGQIIKSKFQVKPPNATKG